MGMEPNHPFDFRSRVWAVLRRATGLILLCAGCSRETRTLGTGDAFAGSASCRQCHEKFYTLWSTSHHGLAMQPVTKAFARQALTAQTNAIEIGNCLFRADIDARVVREEGAGGRRAYPMAHAMGGKNVYYFLTPLERGRLQVLPLAYDVRQQEWINAGASMVRHFGDTPDAPLEWHDPQLTFNTACFGCHVSQLSKNYDLKSDTYHTVWREPGINCEACHGPGGEHVRVCQEAPTNTVPHDLKIISMKKMTPAQSDETCATCHAKMRPITTAFIPGARFFDHFDLVTFESPDFYPDGRDLGENYTYTLWLTNPCVKSGKLDCTHCHTSSGRYKFAGEKTNESCMPCHQKRVENATEHTHHKPDSKGNQCVSCHMPSTTFARMQRSDHSLRPPTPATTLSFKSPNACNLCHTDKDAAWADAHVRKWRTRDYQAPVLYRAGLIAAARGHKWGRLDDILTFIGDAQSDPIFVVSLLRLLETCGEPRKWPALREALGHSHPLVRSAAAQALEGDVSQVTFDALATASKDDFRLVRTSAASSLARDPHRTVPESVFTELEASLRCFPDAWSSHYNIGNYYEARGKPTQALASYEQAMRLRSDMIPPFVNAAMLVARQGNLKASLRYLNKAEKIDPKHPAVNLNLGLALAEQGKMVEAERHFRTALATDATLAQAAYNLGVLLNRAAVSEEGIGWCRKAADLQPQNPAYVYTLAFYLTARGNTGEAVKTLQDASLRGVSSDEITTLQNTLQKR